MATAIMLYSFGAKEGEKRGVMELEMAQSCLTPEIDLQSSKGKVVIWATDSSRIQDRLPQFQVVYLEPSWAEKSPEAIASDIMHWLEYRGNDKREYKNALAFVVPSSVQMDKARSASRSKLAIVSLLEQKQKYKFTIEEIEELKAKEKTCLADLNASLRKLYQEVFIGVTNTGIGIGDSDLGFRKKSQNNQEVNNQQRNKSNLNSETLLSPNSKSRTPNPDSPNSQLPTPDSYNPIRLENIDLQSQINVSDKLQEKVLEALKNHVFDSLTVNKLIRLANLTPEKPYLKISDLVSYFFRFPSYPKLISSEPIVRAIASAIEQGKLGYIPSIAINGWQSLNPKPQIPNPTPLPVIEDINLIRDNSSIPMAELDLNGYLLTTELIEQLREEIKQKIEIQTPDEQSYTPSTTPNPSVKEPTIKLYLNFPL